VLALASSIDANYSIDLLKLLIMDG